MIKPRIGRTAFSMSPLDMDSPHDASSGDHANASAEEDIAAPGATVMARFPPSWRRRRRLIAGRQADDEGELPETPPQRHDPDDAIDAASLQAHSGAQQQQDHGQSESRRNPGGGQPNSAAAAPESIQTAHEPAAAATLFSVNPALQQILQRYRSAPADQARPALAQALLRLRDGVLDRSLPASFNIASWMLLREHLTRAASDAASPAQTLEQVRAQLMELVRPTSSMPAPAAQTLHLLLPLLLLHAERPRPARHRQRTIAMLDTLCAGLEGVRA